MATRSIRFALLLGCLLPLASPADARETWVDRPHGIGNGSGTRPALGARGIVPHALYTSGVWSNVRGGLHSGTRYEGFADWGIDADLDKLVGWQAARFYIDWHSYHGGQPSEDLVGAFLATAVSELEAERSFRFYQIYLEQRFLEGRLLAKAGQLALDEDFMVSVSTQVFRNAAFGDFISNSETASAAVYPLAAPGLYLEAQPLSGWRLRLGVYSGDPGEDEKDNIGFDWSISSHAGATIFGEIETAQSPFGLTGSYSLGAMIQTGSVDNFEAGGQSDGVYVLYAMIDQTLMEIGRAKSATRSKLSGFLRILLPTQRDRTAIDWHLNGGLVLDGPIPGRDEDAAALGFSFQEFSHDYLNRVRGGGLRVTSSELMLELTYRARITGWLTLQPDLQYFVDPHFGRSDALVLGLSVVIDL